MDDKKEERIAVFIDGSNFYHIIRNLFPDKKPNDFNFEKFCSFLVGNRKLVKIYYYNVPLQRKKNEEKYIKQQKFFDKIKRITNFNLILCRMQKQKIDGKIVYIAKEDDIQLAVDTVKLAYKNFYDTAIIVSSDGDFAPAILAIKEIGKKAENIGFENKFSYHLKQKCDKFIKLKKDILDKFFEEKQQTG